MWNQHLMNRLQNVVFLLVMCGGLFVAPVAVSAETLEPANAAQNERFYAVLLSYQSADNSIAMSHTFAAFYRTAGVAPHQRVVETRTISWLPVSWIVSV